MGDGSLANSISNGSSGGNGASAGPARSASRMGSRAGIRKVINVVDDRMLIFDPPDTNPTARMQRAAFPTSSTTRIREHRFVFDRLFDEEAAQEEVYANTTRPLLDSVLDGYNATVFAYGATGCGKTHTISGTPRAPGIIFLTMKELFERINDLRDTKHVDVSLSYLEIYNETIRDLLEPSCKQLALREDSESRILVSNLSTHKPSNVEEVMEMILQGNQNRTISPTEANATSSRSHAVLQINVVQKNRTAAISEAHTFATLSIIDLAGSERASATKNRGERLLEGANINKSLLALGNCINALCDPRRHNHVPYRDSKLTRLLKFSLGGNCKTVMIVCVSPSSRHYDETLNTLKYADRAKRIKTKVIRNEHNLDRHVGSYLKMITEQKAEIEELRRRESKAVGHALAQEARARQRCQTVLEDAAESLRQTYARAEPLHTQLAAALRRMKLVATQARQVAALADAAQRAGHGDTRLSAELARVSESLEAMRRAQEQVLTQLTQERHAAVVHTTAMLTRRLEDAPGITAIDRASFSTYAKLLRSQADVELYNGLAEDDSGSAGALTAFADVVFAVMSTAGVEKLAEQQKFFARLGEGANDNAVVDLSAIFSAALTIKPESPPRTQPLQQSSLENKSPRTSDSRSSNSNTDIVNGHPPHKMRRVLNNNSAPSGIAKIRRRPAAAADNSPSSVSGNGHGALAGGVTGLGTLHKKQQVVLVKSPMRSLKRVSRRVRWEDGKVKVDLPVSPTKRRSGEPVYASVDDELDNEDKEMMEVDVQATGLLEQTLEDTLMDEDLDHLEIVSPSLLVPHFPSKPATAVHNNGNASPKSASAARPGTPGKDSNKPRSPPTEPGRRRTTASPPTETVRRRMTPSPPTADAGTNATSARKTSTLMLGTPARLALPTASSANKQKTRV
jgi:kinesin family protein 18/19